MTITKQLEKMRAALPAAASSEVAHIGFATLAELKSGDLAAAEQRYSMLSADERLAFSRLVGGLERDDFICRMALKYGFDYSPEYVATAAKYGVDYEPRMEFSYLWDRERGATLKHRSRWDRELRKVVWTPILDI